MSAYAPSRRPGVVPLAIGALTLVAALVGAAAGMLFPLPTADPGRAATPPKPAIVAVPGARLLPPNGWERLAKVPAIPGLDRPGSAVALRAPGSDVVLASAPPSHSSLLPAAWVAELTPPGVPRPRLIKAGTRQAWSYELPGQRFGTQIAALVLPTNRAVLTLACVAPSGAAYPATDCETALGALELQDAATLPSRPETAAQLVMPSVVKALNERRAPARAGLATTSSPRGRQAAANAIATSYAAAGRRAAPVAAGKAAGLPAAFAALEADYRALGRAAALRRPITQARAGAAIARDEKQLAARLAALSPRADD